MQPLLFRLGCAGLRHGRANVWLCPAQEGQVLLNKGFLKPGLVCNGPFVDVRISGGFPEPSSLPLCGSGVRTNAASAL